MKIGDVIAYRNSLRLDIPITYQIVGCAQGGLYGIKALGFVDSDLPTFYYSYRFLKENYIKVNCSRGKIYTKEEYLERLS